VPNGVFSTSTAAYQPRLLTRFRHTTYAKSQMAHYHAKHRPSPSRGLSTIQCCIIMFILAIYVCAAVFIGWHYYQMHRQRQESPGGRLDPRLIERRRYQSPRPQSKSYSPLMWSSTCSSADHPKQRTPSALEAQVQPPTRRSALSRLPQRPGWVTIGKVEEGLIARRRQSSLPVEPL
jgi:hypothetical protein